MFHDNNQNIQNNMNIDIDILPYGIPNTNKLKLDEIIDSIKNIKTINYESRTNLYRMFGTRCLLHR